MQCINIVRAFTKFDATKNEIDDISIFALYSTVAGRRCEINIIVIVIQRQPIIERNTRLVARGVGI